MSKPQTLEQAAKKYAARVEYRMRLTRLMNRCTCSRAEETEYDECGRCTYPGYPRCFENEGHDWCVRCLRRNRLFEVRKKAYAAERNCLRGLLNAARRAGEDTL